jgi:hypothetical protein
MNETGIKRSCQALADVSNIPQPLHTVTAACLDNKQLLQQQQNQQKQLVITSSGFKGAAKKQIQQLSADIGAVYFGELVQGLTTHLVGAQQQAVLSWTWHRSTASPELKFLCAFGFSSLVSAGLQTFD